MRFCPTDALDCSFLNEKHRKEESPRSPIEPIRLRQGVTWNWLAPNARITNLVEYASSNAGETCWRIYATHCGNCERHRGSRQPRSSHWHWELARPRQSFRSCTR